MKRNVRKNRIFYDGCTIYRAEEGEKVVVVLEEEWGKFLDKISKQNHRNKLKISRLKSQLREKLK